MRVPLFGWQCRLHRRTSHALMLGRHDPARRDCDAPTHRGARPVSAWDVLLSVWLGSITIARLRPRIGRRDFQTGIVDIYGNLHFFDMLQRSPCLGEGGESG